ncbi:unnamed protein product [Cylicocyclus nassatus]|uniref:Uncharacterized protein n=1 Tax=Cylicocyclus nassatus TaxID=53992 RepID=A0AA36GV67_CYLNA|nr:unnamed protein product [Cylicocyclus nassatus]
MDSKDSKVYAEAVAESKRPEGAISAEVTRATYNGYTIPNLSYFKWFRHGLAKLIATLFSKESTLASLDSMISALQNCVKKKYISIETMDIYSCSNLEKIPQFK